MNTMTLIAFVYICATGFQNCGKAHAVETLKSAPITGQIDPAHSLVEWGLWKHCQGVANEMARKLREDRNDTKLEISLGSVCEKQ